MAARLLDGVVQAQPSLAETRRRERAALADEHRDEAEPELVDQARLEQGVGEGQRAPDDDVLVAILQNGSLVRMFETGLEPPPPSPPLTVVPSDDQHTLTVSGAAAELGAGAYRVTVRVNGQQARVSASLDVA